MPCASTVRFVLTRTPSRSNRPNSENCIELTPLFFLLLIVSRKYLALVPCVAVAARAAPGLVNTVHHVLDAVGAAKSVRTSRSVHVSPSFDPCRRKSRGERHVELWRKQSPPVAHTYCDTRRGVENVRCA